MEELRFRQMEEESKAFREQTKLDREARDIAKQQKKEEIVRKLQQRKDQIRNESIATNEVLIKVKHEDPIFKKLSRNFLDQQLPLLEERKKKLEEIRSLSKPLAQSGIGEHLNTYKIKKSEII